MASIAFQNKAHIHPYLFFGKQKDILFTCMVSYSAVTYIVSMKPIRLQAVKACKWIFCRYIIFKEKC